MSMSVEERIKLLKNHYNEATIEKAKCEANLEGLEKQKADLIEECEKRGVDFENLDAIKDEYEKKLEELLSKGEQLSGITPENFDTDTRYETPF